MSASAALPDLIKDRLQPLLPGQEHVCSLAGNTSLCLFDCKMLSGEV